MATQTSRLLAASEAERERLVAFYNAVMADLNERLAQAEAREATGTVRYLEALKAEANAVLATLRSGTAQWTDEAVPAIYQANLDDTDNRLAGLGIADAVGFPVGPIHTRAVEALVEATNTRWDGMLTGLGRRVDDEFRAAGMEAARQSLVGYGTVQDVARSLRQKITDEFARPFVDKAGRTWDTKTYSQMVARTLTREVQTEGTRNRCLEMGCELGKVSSFVLRTGEGRPADDTCPAWEGRILDLTGGKHSEYPTVEDAKAGGLFHPNCKHTLLPHVDLAARRAELRRELGMDPEEELPPKAEAEITKKATKKELADDQDQAELTRRAKAVEGIRAEAAKLRAYFDGDSMSPNDHLQLQKDRVRAESEVRVRRQDVDHGEGLLAEWKARTGDDRPPDWQIEQKEAAVAALRASLEASEARLESIMARLQTVKVTDIEGALAQDREVGRMVREEAEARLGRPLSETELDDLDNKTRAARDSLSDTKIELANHRDAKPSDPDALAAWQKRFDELVDEGAVKEAEVQRLVQRKRLGRTGLIEETEAWDADMASLVRRMNDAKKTCMAIQDTADPTYKALMAKIKDMEDERGAMMKSKPSAKRAFLEVISEVRDEPMGYDKDTAPRWSNKPKAEYRRAIDDVAGIYPRSWWKASADATPIRLIATGSRGYYGNVTSELSLGRDLSRSTAAHELGHRMEYTIPGVQDLARQFLFDRTNTGGTQAPLARLGSGYKRDEVTRTDAFMHPYMGKHYGYGTTDSRQARATEIVSMGMEILNDRGLQYRNYAGPSMLTADPDYLDFLLGMLGGL